MKKKIALITGITGQDGSYLSELLIEKGYHVHGIVRRSSSENTTRLNAIIGSKNKNKLKLHYGDLLDQSSILKIISEIKPKEIYNLAAQSDVAISFEQPEYTSQVNAIGTLKILDSIVKSNLGKYTKFYQASTSELYGLIREKKQSETTPFYPRSPYSIAKLYAYWITINYREAYNLFATNGILFNHESPRRGENFVSRKITKSLCEILFGLRKTLYLGNLDSKRDWGHAKDYVKMQWLMLQQKNPNDYVIATGKISTVREFLIKSAKYIGIKLEFSGRGIKEIAKIKSIKSTYKTNLKIGDIVVRVDKKFFRPTEVDILLGDSSKANSDLGWKPDYNLNQLIEDMMNHEIKNIL